MCASLRVCFDDWGRSSLEAILSLVLERKGREARDFLASLYVTCCSSESFAMFKNRSSLLRSSLLDPLLCSSVTGLSDTSTSSSVSDESFAASSVFSGSICWSPSVGDDAGVVLGSPIRSAPLVACNGEVAMLVSAAGGFHSLSCESVLWVLKDGGGPQDVAMP
jgi:hypothetical protein